MVRADNKLSRQSRWEWLQHSGMLVLLLLLGGTVFIGPAVVSYGITFRLVSDVMLTLILASGILAVSDHRKHAIVLAVVSVIVVAARWTEWIVPIDMLVALREVSTLIALLVLASAVGINVFARGHVLADRIFGSIVLYLLIGLVWAIIYAMVDSSLPTAFSGARGTHGDPTVWVYFSLVTLTTLGYGDITPVARVARSLATLEALIGQLYPAIIIARLVSLQVTPK